VETIKEVIVEKPVEIEVIKEVIIEKPVEVINEVVIEKPIEVEVIKEVVIEKPVEIEVIKEIEKIVEVAAECPITSNNSLSCPENTNLPENSATFMIKSWAKDWSNQNVDAYIDHYVKNYSHKDDKSHDDWVELRKVRLKKPTFINIELKDIQVDNVDNNLAIVMLTQHYRSNTINDEIKKLLVLVNEGGKWKIQRERALL